MKCRSPLPTVSAGPGTHFSNARSGAFPRLFLCRREQQHALYLPPEIGATRHEAIPVNQPVPHFERFLNSREAAALLQIHLKTLQRLARKGEIRAMRIGKLWRFRTSDLHAWVDLRLRLANYPYRPDQ